MIDYRPAAIKTSIPPQKTFLSASEPPPAPDFMLTGYTGAQGAIEAVAVLTVLAAAAVTGIRAGLSPDHGRISMRAIGWIGGVGSAILGLLYLGGRSGYGQAVSLPAVRVTPS